MKEYGLYLSGKSRKPPGGNLSVTQNPANGEALAFFVGGTAEDVDQAVEAASLGFRVWKIIPLPREVKFCSEPKDRPFDVKRMVYGGFKVLVDN